MKKALKIVIIAIFVILIINVGVFACARYGWKLFEFKYCNPTAFVSSIEVKENIIEIKGNTADSMSSYVGYTYKIIDDKLYVGVKHNYFFGFFERLGAFSFKLKLNTTEINEIYLKYSDNQKKIWGRQLEPEQPNSDFDIKNITKMTIFNTSYFDININNVKFVSIDAEKANRLISTAIHKDELVFRKGYTVGYVGNNNETRQIKISSYGGFFTIDKVDGFFTVLDEHREEWENMVNDFTYEPDEFLFSGYNRLLNPGDGQLPNEHLFLSFSEDESFIFCMHKSEENISIEKIWEFLKWKYDSGVKLSKYLITNAPHDNIKLVFEDGTYFEWDYFEHMKYLCNVK